ncbi:MAG: FMN-binding protein [Lachnospiraceae bacterium]|nr:FMN-binding protein [Lachnospiraceae bacterium]
MSEKKNTMIKDAIILCLITLVLGAILAGVYAMTKDTIDAKQKEANNEACAAVVISGDKVQDSDADALKKAEEYLTKHGLSNEEVADEGSSLIKHVEISEVHPTEQGGYVFLATAKKGYGGDIGFALGVGADGAITGISITSQGETAGLGANCMDETWQKSFQGKTMPASPSENMYNKNAESDTQVQALSGATVTTKAITNAVKGILFFADTVKGAE